MSFTNLIRVAIRAILSNKSRTLLSTLGIIIGVAAVIIMMSIGQGSKESIRKEISKMGSNVITVRPGADMRGGVRQDPSAMQTLKMSDYESMLSGLKYVQHVSPEVTQAGQVVNGNNNTTTTIYGEAPEYMTIKLWTVQEGDCFTDEDVRKNAKVCVIGKTVADELFPGGQNPIGRSIRFKNIPFRVVGVLKSKGYNNWGMDQDNLIIAPYTTVMKRIAAQTYFSSISVSALSEEVSEKAIEELTALLRANHKIKEGMDDDFTIRSQQEIMETMSSTMDRHRHHEHHACECDGAHEGNRPAHECRRPRTRHFAPVPLREHHHLAVGRPDRHRCRLSGQLGGTVDDVARQRASVERPALVRRVCLHWSHLRLCTCQKSGADGSHRSAQV